jgi:catechol 2,3-dioxygenase-like lactoylglutathione lyase family enzyme
MKRFHVHLAVENLDTSLTFYRKLFGAEPTVQKPDYAKWMLEDPRINFAISARGAKPGVDHLGFQVDSTDELVALREHAAKADLSAIVEDGTACCYAESDKHWITDPQGVAWEHYHTLADIPVFNRRTETAEACCPPNSSVDVAVAPPVQPKLKTCAPASGCC